jgi:hypothetical protein
MREHRLRFEERNGPFERGSLVPFRARRRGGLKNKSP